MLALMQGMMSLGVGGGGGGTVTWNPADKAASIALSGGNKTATSSVSSVHEIVRATLGRSTGKWYFEISFSPAGGATGFSGVSPNTLAPSGNYPGISATSWGYLQLNGNKYNSGSAVGFGADFNGVANVGTAIDLDLGRIWWAKDGVWQASGNPAANTNPAYTGLSGTLFPTASFFESARVCVGRFAAADLIYAPPAGFAAWDS